MIVGRIINAVGFSVHLIQPDSTAIDLKNSIPLDHTASAILKFTDLRSSAGDVRRKPLLTPHPSSSLQPLLSEASRSSDSGRGLPPGCSVPSSPAHSSGGGHSESCSGERDLARNSIVSAGDQRYPLIGSTSERLAKGIFTGLVGNGVYKNQLLELIARPVTLPEELGI